MKKLVRSRALGHAILSLLVFFVLIQIFELNALIVFLNGGFGGAVAAVLVAFGPLIYNTIRNKEPYNRAREMALGWFGLWIAYVLVVYVSTESRSFGNIPKDPSYLTALSRWIAIYSAGLQVSAPDFGLGLFHGRERKVFYGALVVGLTVAAVLWYVQGQQVLSDLAQQAFGTVEPFSGSTGPAKVTPTGG